MVESFDDIVTVQALSNETATALDGKNQHQPVEHHNFSSDIDFYHKKFQVLKVDAVANIVRSRRAAIQIAWLILFFSGIGASAYLITVGVSRYLEYKVSSSVRLVTDADSFVHSFTFCNINPFASDFGLDMLVKANVTYPANDYEPTDHWLQYLQIEDYFYRTRGSYMTTEEKLNLTNLDMFVPFIAASAGLQKAYPFDVNSLERIFHPKYFGCLRWNKTAEFNQRAFNVYIYIGGESDASNEMINKRNNGIKGLYVLVQNNSDYEYGTDRSPIIVNPGRAWWLTLQQRRLYEQQPVPYGDCSVLDDNILSITLPDSYLFDQVVSTGSAYTAYFEPVLNAR